MFVAFVFSVAVMTAPENSSWPSFRMARAAAVLAAQALRAIMLGLLRPIPDPPMQPNLAAMPQALM